MVRKELSHVPPHTPERSQSIASKQSHSKDWLACDFWAALEKTMLPEMLYNEDPFPYNSCWYHVLPDLQTSKTAGHGTPYWKVNSWEIFSGRCCWAGLRTWTIPVKPHSWLCPSDMSSAVCWELRSQIFPFCSSATPTHVSIGSCKCKQGR